MLSRGEYVFFMDNDDMLKPLALEEMYVLAKNFDADVVYFEMLYVEDFTAKKFQPATFQKGGQANEPTLETEDLAERVQGIFGGRYWVTPWCKLVRRDLMMEHELFFPNISIGDDDIWTCGLLFYAKKILRVPDAVYFYRTNEESVLRKRKTPEQLINFWTNPILFGIKTLDNLMSDLDFFQKNPSYRYAVLENFITGKIFNPHRDEQQMPPFKIYETIKKEFGDKLGEQDVLVSALCTYAMTVQKMNYMISTQAQQRIAQLEAELAKKT